MRVEDAMTRTVETCSPDDGLNVAASIMWNRDIGCLPVVEGSEGRIVGMITDRDICMAAYTTGAPIQTIPVRNVMAHKIAAVTPHDHLHAAEHLMRSAQVHRVPVVAPDGKVVGMLTLNDIVRFHARPAVARTPEVSAEEVAMTLAAITMPREAPTPTAVPSAPRKNDRGRRPAPCP